MRQNECLSVQPLESYLGDSVCYVWAVGVYGSVCSVATSTFQLWVCGKAWIWATEIQNFVGDMFWGVYVCLQRCVCMLSVIGRLTCLNLYVTTMLLRHSQITHKPIFAHTRTQKIVLCYTHFHDYIMSCKVGQGLLRIFSADRVCVNPARWWTKSVVSCINKPRWAI